jgi:hypothetical protein
MSAQRPGPRAVRYAADALEPRRLLAFTPLAMPVTPTNPVQVVRAIVLNYEPTVPSEGNRTLWQIFGWRDPRELAAGYIADMEAASGGAIDFQIVEWRDLREFPIFTDGSRYTPDQYVQNRRTDTGWSNAGADFYAMAEQQGLADLVKNDVVDEFWCFGDHYFGLYGESWMAGPQSFFINGPSFPDFHVDRAVAGYFFSYERGVAEMIHNTGHRTENHVNRAYNYQWNTANPVTPWDFFTTNAAQSPGRTTFGVGNTHFPFNGAADYDYANTRTFPSFADDFVASFPNPTYAAVPTTRDAWGDVGAGDWQRGYLRWMFGHVPRGAGTAADGRQNNWYKYVWDFNSYRPNTGLPRDNEAIFDAAPINTPGGASHDFTVRYYDVQSINPASLGTGDVRATGPNGFSALATVVSTGTDVATTAGKARTVKYRIAAPGGTWDAADAGTYTVGLQASQVTDAAGTVLPAATLGTFRVDLTPEGLINVAGLLAGGQATVTATTWDTGGPAALFDNNAASLYRTPNIDPAVVTLTFGQAQSLHGFRALVSHAGGNPAYQWKVETADSVADLDAGTGSYRLAVPFTGAASDVTSSVTLAAPITACAARLTVTRLTGDDYVHINEWQLVGPPTADTAPPAATLLAPPAPAVNAATSGFQVRYTDDRAVDIRTINFGDVRVTGPNGFAQTAALLALDQNLAGPDRTVTYFLTAPGGAWDYSDNGTYTVELLPGQVRDSAGKPAPAGPLGQFTVALPPPQPRPPADMTESNAADWVARASGATASASNDTTRKTLGASSVRFDTTGGFDTYLRYEPPDGADWNLAAATRFRFDVFAQNASPLGFQESPTLRFVDRDGDYYEFRYYRNGGLYNLHNDARGQWLSQQVDLKSGATPATGWRRTAVGTPDWAHMRTVELHADTWEFGFALWYDRVGFDLPVAVTSTAFATAPAGDSLTFNFDVGVGTSLADSDLDLRNVLTGAAVPARASTDASGRVGTFTFPTLPGQKVPSGLYHALLPAGAVADAADNPSAAPATLDFLVVNDGTSLVLPPGAQTYVVHQAVLGTGSRLDIAGNTVVVQDPAGTAGPTAAVTAATAAGSHGGRWDGTGIVSSAAASDPNALTGIGYVDDGHALTFRATRYGDANLDARVDADDAATIVLDRATGKTGWSAGNFNYDAAIDADDFILFTRGAAASPASPPPAATFSTARATDLVTAPDESTRLPLPP